KSGAAILALPVRGTLKRSLDKQSIAETVSRENLWEAQTPQVAKREWLTAAFAARNGFNATDESQLLERAGKKVALVLGSSLNIKITTREDLKLAEQALKILPQPQLFNAMNPFADEDKWK
ncbi:MAG: 2-C-methyl-D-erythritol 4-phosphate cytidylyltransferase, partial [Pirellulales bacterium]